MKKYLILLVILLSVPFLVNANPKADSLIKQSRTNFFIENKGQWDPEVKYLAKIGGMNAWITDNGIVYDFYKIEYDEGLNIDSLRKAEPSDWMKKRNENARRLGHVVRMNFIDCLKQTPTDRSVQQTQDNNSHYVVLCKDKLETYYNYFIGNDSTKWASYVGLYKEVIIKNVYEGIDYRLYFDKGMLRYDLNIQPFADLEQIRMKYEGQEGLEVNEDGELVINTSIGEVTNQKLYAYQNSYSITKETEIPVYFIQYTDGSIGFSTRNYDKSLALTIDPLIYSTFIGGVDFEFDPYITINYAGEVYVTGWTNTYDFPTTSGAYDVSHNGDDDVFVSMLNASGTSLIYSTFIGGTKSDIANGITIDGMGAAYVTGFTQSPTYPTTIGAFDRIYNGGTDVFVTKLNASGTSLIYSTFIGGFNSDEANGITIDGMGTAYMTGHTHSSDYPTSSGTYDESYNGDADVFITKLNAVGSSLIYSTFIGGNNRDEANGITIEGTGAAYVTGHTYSSDYPTSSGTYDESYNGGADVFITKLNASGSYLIYSTFIGGNNRDNANCITIDGTGAAYATGETNSSNYPATSGAFDESFNGGIADVFVTKLNASGTSLIYSTYIGGVANDFGESISIDGMGAAYITGGAFSYNFPMGLHAYDTTYNGWCDFFISKLDPSGTQLRYSTFIGGTTTDHATSIAVYSTDVVYVAGSTTSPEFPTTNDAFDESFNGNRDISVIKMSFSLMSIRTSSINQRSYCPGSSISIPFTIAGSFNSENIFTAQLSDESGAFSYPVNIGTLPGTSVDTIIATIPFDIPEGYSYRVRVISSNPEITGSDNGADIKIYSLPTPQINDIPDPVCAGNTYEYTSYLPGGLTNKWGAVGGTIVGVDNGANVNILWGSESSGTVTLEQSNFVTGCKDSIFQTITINPLPAPQITNAPNLVCAGNLYTYTGNITIEATNRWEAAGGTIIGSDAEEYVNIIWGTDSIGIVKLIQTNSYTGCLDSVSQSIAIYSIPNKEIFGKNPVCQGFTEYYNTYYTLDVTNSWSVENGTIIGLTTADTILVEWDSAGMGTVTLIRTDTLTNCTDTTVKDIIIKPAPIVTYKTPTKQLCLSDSAYMLIGGNPIGGTYSGKDVINDWFDPIEAGDYEITYTYTNDEGCSYSAKDTINVLPNPEKPTITKIQRKLISSDAISYQWYLDSTIIPSATEKEFTPTKKGYYQVEVTDENGCKSISDVFYFGSIGVDDKQEKENILSIKPNPFSETTSIIFTLQECSFVSLVITNLLGINVNEIYTNKYMESGQHVVQLKVNSLPNGVYYCTLKIGNHVETVKMVVVR